MDRAADVAIKAVILGLYRSKAINARQVTVVAAELGYAATHLTPPDAQVSADIEALGQWLEKAIEGENRGRNLLSRF